MRVYYASSPLFTLRRYTDGSFRDRWSGLWFCDFKVLNYFAVETATGWAHYSNAVGFDGRELKHIYDVNGQIFEEKISVGGNFCLEASPEATMFELGFAVRSVYEDSFANPPTVDKNVISSGKYSFGIFVDGKDARIRKYYTKEDYQGDRKTKTFVVSVAGGKKLEIAPLLPKRFYSEERVERPSRHPLILKAVDVVKTLEKRKGWYAGLPWFLQYWGRDLFWSTDGLLNVYPGKKVEKAVLEFLIKNEDGEVPRLIHEDGYPEYGSWDTNPLCILALFTLARKKRDTAIIKEYKSEILEVFHFFDSISSDFLVKNVRGRSWMDSLQRKYAVEIQALWYAAARELEAYGLISGYSEEIKRAFDAKKDIFLSERSANVLVAGIYGLITPEEAVSFAKREKLIANGVRSLSPNEMEYNRGYHTGASWGLTTGWGIKVALMAGDVELAGKLVSDLAARENLDECWDPETGKPLGADTQLWTAGMILSLIGDKRFEKVLNSEHGFGNKGAER